jgi:hypothetical protein
LTVLAATCLIISAYFIWAAERKKVVALRAAMAPGLKIDFVPNAMPYFYTVQVEDKAIVSSPKVTFKCFRVKITNSSNDNHNFCKAQIKTVQTTSGKSVVSIPFSLRVSNSDTDTFRLVRGPEIIIDVLALQGGSEMAKLAAFGDKWPIAGARIPLPLLGAVLPGHDASIITLQVISDGGPPSQMRLCFDPKTRALQVIS